MIEIINASIRYDDIELFRHLNLSIEKGTLACITGPSGYGKSSLLHAILGIVPLAEGSIRINGKELNEENIFAIRRHIAWLPQELSFPCEWVSEMVQLPFTLKASRKKIFQKDIFFSLMHRLGLEEELYDKRVNEISGGQRQRLMIASAILLERAILLIDEPTSALDGDSAFSVLTLLHDLAQRGSTVLSVSHDPAYIEGCDRIINIQTEKNVTNGFSNYKGNNGNN